MDRITNEPTREREDDMSSLVAGFSAWMRKRAARAQGETTPGSEVPSNKRPKWSVLNDEVQRSPTVVTLDPPKQAFNALLALEGAAQGVPKETCASLEDGILAGGPPSANNVMDEAPSVETVVRPLLSARQFNLTISAPRGPRGPDMLVLNSPIKPMK